MSLQSIFWVVGIIVGLLSIAQYVVPYVKPLAEAESDDTKNTSDVNETGKVKKTAEVSEPQPKLTALDSPSVKIDNYTAYDNGIAVDNDLGIMWMRCSLGQQWDGSTCEGNAKKYTLEEARQAIDQLNTVSYVGLYNWQLPDIEAMQFLIYCSEGYGSYQITLKSGVKKTVEAGCVGDFKVPAINEDVFPNTQWSAWRGYWSSSQNDKDEPLTVYFDTGEIKAIEKPHYVRAMRYAKSDK